MFFNNGRINAEYAVVSMVFTLVSISFHRKLDKKLIKKEN